MSLPLLLRHGLIGCLLLAGWLPAAAGGEAGKKLLWVANPASRFHATDAAVLRHLQSLGYSELAANGGAADPAQADLVVISGTLGAHRIEPRYLRLARPILTWNPLVLPDLGMTGMERGRDFDYDTRGRQLFLYFVNAPHPLGAGLPNGMLIPYIEDDSQDRISWGRPGLGATVLATLPGEFSKAVYFAYEKGALMNGAFSAPARRVMLFLSEETFDQLNPSGLKLFDAAVAWAAGGISR